MRSPLQELRERLELTVGEMAQALGLMYTSYYNAERGLAAIPRKAKAAIEELGCDVDALADQQAMWLAEQGSARRQAILQKMGALNGCESAPAS